MTHERALVIIPTYNEKDNIDLLIDEILRQSGPFDLLFVDDNSPDGTGRILDEHSQRNPRIKVLHRPGKLGIGSAHRDAILWAYDHKYETVITMDADFTHPPYFISLFLEQSAESAVIVASRYLQPNSLPGWALWRKFLTHLGHFLTTYLLGIPHDATGALRLYRLTQIPKRIFLATTSKGYSFLFESLYLIYREGFPIAEIPIALPARTYGTSKMRLSDMFQSLVLLFILMRRRFASKKFAGKTPTAPEWDEYWATRPAGFGRKLYSVLAHIYRTLLIRPAFQYHLRKNFPPSSSLLHAGCGSGECDSGVAAEFSITALDFSSAALQKYTANVACRRGAAQADIRLLPFADSSFDGIYNLGVMEHFAETELDIILAEFARVLKSHGKILLLWPPEYGSSVVGFKLLSALTKSVLRMKTVKFHPDEICRLRSRGHAQTILGRSGFLLEEYSFGPRDAFTQVAVIARKKTR